jgi:hypothetical protein
MDINDVQERIENATKYETRFGKWVHANVRMYTSFRYLTRLKSNYTGNKEPSSSSFSSPFSTANTINTRERKWHPSDVCIESNPELFKNKDEWCKKMRLPNNGMLLKALRDENVNNLSEDYVHVTADNTLWVSNTPEHERCAKRMGIEFIFDRDFFSVYFQQDGTSLGEKSVEGTNVKMVEKNDDTDDDNNNNNTTTNNKRALDAKDKINEIEKKKTKWSGLLFGF